MEKLALVYFLLKLLSLSKSQQIKNNLFIVKLTLFV